MNTNVTPELGQLVEAWRVEDRELSTAIDGIRQWMSEVNLMGIPHFGETASRLLPLQRFLENHFAREDALLDKLAKLYPSASPEVAAFRRQTQRDHESLLEALQDLHDRLSQTEPEFRSWTEAMDQVDVYFAQMEQHELQEFDRLCMLIPGMQGDAEDSGGLMP
jgi:molybdopterin converting factor small subunit